VKELKNLEIFAFFHLDLQPADDEGWLLVPASVHMQATTTYHGRPISFNFARARLTEVKRKKCKKAAGIKRIYPFNAGMA
jgi:hypothetical protein